MKMWLTEQNLNTEPQTDYLQTKYLKIEIHYLSHLLNKSQRKIKPVCTCWFLGLQIYTIFYKATSFICHYCRGQRREEHRGDWKTSHSNKKASLCKKIVFRKILNQTNMTKVNMIKFMASEMFLTLET